MVWAVVAVKAVVGWVMVTLFVVVHEFASVIIQVYVPAANPVLPGVVIPPPQLKVYGAVPPVGVKLIAPFDPPLQDTLVWAVVAVKTVGCVMVTLVGDVLQLFASVISNVYVLAANPVLSLPMSPSYQTIK